MLNSSITRVAIPAILCFGLLPNHAEAGPLIDWLFGRYRTQPAYPVGPPVPVGNAGANYGANYGYYGPNPVAPNAYSVPPSGYAANYGTYYGSRLPVIGPAGAGYQANMPSGITAATMPPTVSYVPNYSSYANRAPVTYYRPLLTTDPNTGAQVVAMAPCTSYEYQTQRVPTFGRSALFGSSAPPAVQPAPNALPTYTLPSGGIPLAAGTPSVMAPTVRGYSPYGSTSSLQPPVGGYLPYGTVQTAPAGSYPTAPLGNTALYGSTSGGSCGNFYNPNVPGLIAPQGPTTTQPGAYPSIPASPSYPGGVYPQGAPSTDPADAQPTLPPTFPTNTSAQSTQRPQLRSIMRQPMPSETTSSEPANSGRQNESPVLMKPIPVPEGFEQPSWNPGLLKEDDMTAMHTVSPERAAVAGQAKPIHWASFESEPRRVAKPQVTHGLRPIANTPAIEPATEEPRRITPSIPQNRRYDNTGWKASR